MTEKTALITGASSGIGEELAKIHAKNGDNLVLVARSVDKLMSLKDSLEEEFKISVHFIEKDLSKDSSAKEVFEEVAAEGIQIDYLINNAGFGGKGLFGERDLQDESDMIHLNVLTLTKLTHMFLGGMKQRKSGKILNVASSAALVPGGPYQAVYFATKAYVLSFTNGLASELEGTGVTATSLCPGATETGFAKTAGMTDSKLFQNSDDPKSVAQDGYDAMMNGKMVQTSAIALPFKILLKLIPFMPRKVPLGMVKDMQKD